MNTEDVIAVISLVSSAVAYAMVLSHFAWGIAGETLKPIHKILISVILITIPGYICGLLMLAK